MGAEVKKAAGSNVGKAEKNLENLNADLKYELAQTAVDIAGIADPTPISDVVGAGMSLFKGDFIGAGLSLISVVPYAGDAIGKTAKGARAAKKINDLRKKIEAAIAAVNLAQKTARKNAAAAIRAKRKAAAAQKAAAAKTCKTCSAPSNPYGVVLPSKYGKWSNPNNPGNSDWVPDPNSDRGKAVLKVTGGKPVKFVDGYPDFSPYATKKVEIDMKGNYTSDFTNANKEAGLEVTPPGMTWHHHEDGTTMMLVPKDLNNNVSHTGGASIVADPGY